MTDSIKPPKKYRIIAKGPIEAVRRELGRYTNNPMAEVTIAVGWERPGPGASKKPFDNIHATVWLADGEAADWYSRVPMGTTGSLSWYRYQDKEASS